MTFFGALLASSNVGKMNIICGNGHTSTCASIQIIFITKKNLVSSPHREETNVGFG